MQVSFDSAQYSEELKEAARRIESDALDDTLRNWVVQVFTVWLRDPDGQPHRAVTGVRTAIAAYHFGRNRIDLETASNEHIKKILREGLDEALMKYLTNLFNAWMHDTGGRPSASHQKLKDNAVTSYLSARENLDRLYEEAK